MFSYVSPEALVPADYPLRAIRLLVNRALDRLSGEFDRLYGPGGRDSTAPEKLLRALLLQAFFGAIRAAADGAGDRQQCCFGGSSGCRSMRRYGT